MRGRVVARRVHARGTRAAPTPRLVRLAALGGYAVMMAPGSARAAAALVLGRERPADPTERGVAAADALREGR